MVKKIFKKFKESVVTQPTLQKSLEGVLQTGEKNKSTQKTQERRNHGDEEGAPQLTVLAALPQDPSSTPKTSVDSSKSPKIKAK